MNVKIRWNKEDLERAWNAAIEHIFDMPAHEMSYEDHNKYEELKAPSKAFDEWYERNVVNPPEGWDDHHAT